MPGVEDQSNQTSSKSSPQPPVSSTPPADRQFRLDLLIAAVAALGIAGHLLLRFGFGLRGMAQDFPLYVVLACGGLPLTYRLIQKCMAREFGSDLLAGISIVTSVLMGQFL